MADASVPNGPVPAASKTIWRDLAGAWGPWFVAWVPAFLTLHWTWEMKGEIPYHDSWAFVWQYLDWLDGRYGWKEFFNPHNGHPSAVGKAIYFSVMQWKHGDVSLLPLLSWVFSLIIAVAVLRIARPLWAGTPWLGPLLLFLANLSIFTAAQGHTWAWDFVFQNFIPGASLAVALWVLNSASGWRWRVPVSYFLALLAIFSFGSGFMVGLLLAPMVYLVLPVPWAFRRRAGVTIIWLVAVALAAWIALGVLNQTQVGPETEGRFGELMSHPWMTFQYILVLLGHTLAQGWVFEPTQWGAMIGGLLLLLLLAGVVRLLRHCGERDGWRAAMPWLICCVWAGGNAAMICVARLNATLETALAPRYGTFLHFMPLGVLLLLATLYFHPALRGVMPSWSRRSTWAWGAVAVLLVCQAASWESGHQQFRAFYQRMGSEQASYTFAKVLPLNPDVQWNGGEHFRVLERAAELSARGKLRPVRMVTSTSVDQFRKGTQLSEKFASFELTQRLSDGVWIAEGTCGLSKERVSLPELILLTVQSADAAQKEVVVAFTAPLMPDDFYERLLARRVYPEHYMGWRQVLDVSALPKGKELVVRAYAFTSSNLRIRQIPGEHRLTLP